MSSTLNLLKLLADPTRIRLLTLLNQESLSVAELQEILGMGQSRISTQLSTLKKSALVTHQRSGKNNIYRATLPNSIFPLITKAASELPEADTDPIALRHLLRKRRDKARAYFDQLAGKFGKNNVPGRSWKSLAEALLKILNYRRVADLGSGEGTLSQLLAQKAEQVIAVDNSSKMIDYGQQLAKKHQLTNLEFRLGDLESPPIEDASVDLALFSQALHHAENPVLALHNAHRILAPNGRLVVLDLLQHNFEEARELYADLWLGFSEVELARMLEQSGFKDIEITLVDREVNPPHFQTILATAAKK